jgi:uncharacterized protein (TIGR02246 family)
MASQAQESHHTSTARTPEDADRLFGEYVNAGDLEGLVSLYEPTAVLVRQDGTAGVGTAAIREELGGLIAMRVRITMNVRRVVRDGSDLAALYNDWRASVPGADGTTTEVSGGASEIVRRQADGSWRFVIDDPYARSR